MRQWKLSPTDLASLDKWDDYTEAKEAMFFYTDSAHAPWTVVKSNDKKRARVEAMKYVLNRFVYEEKNSDIVGSLDPLIVGPASQVFEQGESVGRLFPRLQDAERSPWGDRRQFAAKAINWVFISRCHRSGYDELAQRP